MAPSRTTAAPDPAVASPLPLAQFKRFLVVFHTVFVGGLLFLLLLRWTRPAFSWSWHDAVLIGLVAGQLVLYFRFLVFPSEWTLRPRWFIGYFVTSYALWFFEWQLEPGLEWAVWAYMGQMFGSLRPRLSVPLSLAVFAAYFGRKLGWSGMKSLGLTDLLSGGAVILGILSVGLFLYRLVVTSMDRARLIEELKRAQQELEGARAADAELARLRERERLARDLHDSLGHGLVTLSVQLEAVQRLIAVDPAKASAMLGQMKDLTRSSMEQLRRSLAGLRSPGLGDRALLAALTALCEETRERCGLQLSCEVPDTAPVLPRDVEETLWRAAEEAVRNAERHAKAGQISVALHVRPDRVRLSVSDDGIGMPPDAEVRNGHFGLRGLRERVEGQGGTLKIASHAAKGTTIEAQIPLIAELP